jgi:hypothetical protein
MKITTSLTLVVASMLVAGTLLFPYNYAMAGKNHDDSKSNTANGIGDSGNVANMGINVNGHPAPHPHPHPPHTTINTTRSNIKSGAPTNGCIGLPKPNTSESYLPSILFGV